MKKYFKTLILSAMTGCIAPGVFADIITENPLSISPLEVVPGETTDLVMYYNTPVQYQGFEFQMRLPEGVDFVTDPDDDLDLDYPIINTRLTRTHQFQGRIQEPGVCKAIFVSLRNDVIKSGDWILQIPIKISESFSGMGTGSLFECRYGADGGKKEDEYMGTTDFTIYVAPTSITLSETSFKMQVGDEKELTVEYAPASAWNMPITWSTSDPEIAEVNESGKVEAIAKGNVMITATVTDKPEISASCEIEVDIMSGIEAVSAETSSDIAVYNLNGTLVKSYVSVTDLKTLQDGIYLVKRGEDAYKIKVTSGHVSK